MKKRVLDELPTADLQVYVVWLPVLSRLSPEGLNGAVASGAKRLADERVRHYLDPELRLGQSYGPVIQLPAGAPAWDVYFVFAPEVTWPQDPPPPTFWMHQLGAAPPALRLDGKKLADTVKGLLAVPAR